MTFVYFTTTKKYIPYIRKIAGKENEADIRNVMIMGGSRIAVRTVQYMPEYMRTKSLRVIQPMQPTYRTGR